MPEPRFSPGTWTVAPFDSIDKFIRIPEAGIRVDNDDVDPVEASANAHLARTAPELYAELEDLLTINMWTPRSWETRQRMIRRLLIKANGPEVKRPMIEDDDE